MAITWAATIFILTPLKGAQIDGYFKGIEFHPVREYNLELAD
jgi:hypothetical protein